MKHTKRQLTKKSSFSPILVFLIGSVGIISFLIINIVFPSSQRNSFVDNANASVGIGSTGPQSTPTPTNIPVPTATPTPVPPTATPTPTPDTTSPTVTITNPLDGSTVKRNSTVVISANTTDNVAVQRVEFFVNNVLHCTDILASYTCSWVVPSKNRVTYTIRADAYDISGNYASNTSVVTSR